MKWRIYSYIRLSRETSYSPTISSLVNYHRSILYTSRTRVLLRKFSRRREDRNFFASLNGAESRASDIVDEELKLLEISLTQKREDARLSYGGGGGESSSRDQFVMRYLLRRRRQRRRRRRRKAISDAPVTTTRA